MNAKNERAFKKKRRTWQSERNKTMNGVKHNQIPSCLQVCLRRCSHAIATWTTSSAQDWQSWKRDSTWWQIYRAHTHLCPAPSERGDKELQLVNVLSPTSRKKTGRAYVALARAHSEKCVFGALACLRSTHLARAQGRSPGRTRTLPQSGDLCPR